MKLHITAGETLATSVTSTRSNPGRRFQNSDSGRGSLRFYFNIFMFNFFYRILGSRGSLLNYKQFVNSKNYTLPTFFKGFKNDLEEDDLYETYSGHKSGTLGSRLEKLWNKELERSKATNKEPSLRKALFRCFAFEYLGIGLILLFNELVVKTSQILALGKLVSFYMTMTEESNMWEAYFYAGKIILCSFFAVVIGSPTSFSGYQLGIKMRVACCSLIYRKALKLNKAVFEKTTTGKIINLISNDTKSFERFCQMSYYIWIAPIQTIFLSYFMYTEAGYSCAFGVAFLLVFIPLHFYMAKIISIYRTKSASRTDDRIRLMNEIVFGVSVIKMYTWEEPFAKLIALYRKLEMKAIRISAHVKGIYLACINVNSRIALFLTILAYVLTNNKINAQQVFVLTGLYNLLRQTMVVFFPNGITMAAEINVCLRRMTSFLLLDEAYFTYQNSKVQESTVIMKNLSAKWGQEDVLKNLNLNFRSGSLTAIVGFVGSGKTSLLHAILQEMPEIDGDVFLNGSISYCSQEPWLFHGNVQQNILFGRNMDLQRYDSVITACSLKRDFLRLPHSDFTIVGDRGASLSGGQKARVNLARAIYKEADLYLLDDPLSAVDTHVGKAIFHKCIKTYLKGKTVVLVTHQLQYLKDVDYIIVLDNGSVLTQGSPFELHESGFDFSKFLDKEVLLQDNKPELKKSDSISSKMSLCVNEEEAPVKVREEKSAGSISGMVYKEYLNSGANCCVATLILGLFVGLQVVNSGCDYFLAYWVNVEQVEDQLGVEQSEKLRKNCLITYSGFIAVLITVSTIRSVVFVETCIKASINLHNSMFQNVIRATLSFFNTNPSGRILNRFSKDMGAIDELLPNIITDTISITLLVLGILIVIAIVNAWLILPATIMMIVFYLLRRCYLPTSRSIKRLDGVTKSPMLVHLNASLQGLVTIRAAGAEKLLVNEFDNHQDLNTCASSLFLSTSKAFGYWLDLCCVIYIASVTISSLLSSNEKYGGNVGLIISQALMLTGVLQWGMRQVAELENQMTSVERVLEYNDIDTEELNVRSENVDRNWPQKGQIEFADLSLKYFTNTSPAINNVSFKIEPQQKVGVVGRTGAGKSSLIQALFRLTEIEGQIFIDRIDTKNVSLHELRSKISIIPQEPILFSGSMRKNLDPFDEFDDNLIWNALEKVELKEAVGNLILGLKSEISEGGTNLSVGQRQLVCLARALLRNNKILVLDEATANVDHVTDSSIQNTIRKEFTKCTVITIAHRLDSVIDCDKILVMNAGQIAEFDQPHVLLQNTEGLFYRMVEETGHSMAQTLMGIAENNYNKIK